MRPTGVPRLVRLGRSHMSLWSVRSPRNHPPADVIITCILPVLCMFLRFLSQYSMNPYVYPTGFGRCPFGCSAGPCRRRTGFGTTYGQSCRPVWGQYRVCRTHMYGRLLEHARLYGPRTGPKIIENRTNPQRGHPPSLIKVFAMRVIGKQGHKASSYE